MTVQPQTIWSRRDYTLTRGSWVITLPRTQGVLLDALWLQMRANANAFTPIQTLNARGFSKGNVPQVCRGLLPKLGRFGLTIDVREGKLGGYRLRRITESLDKGVAP